MSGPALPVGHFDGRGGLRTVIGMNSFYPYTAQWNHAGTPAVSMPVGRTDDGLPLAVQLIARRGDDATLMSLAGQAGAVAPSDHVGPGALPAPCRRARASVPRPPRPRRRHPVLDRRPRVRSRTADSGPAGALAARHDPRRRLLRRDDRGGTAADDGPSVSYVQADVATWEPAAPVDLIVSNAMFQWVPDQLDVIRRLAGRVAHGGAFALQVPNNFDAPSHVLLHELASRAPYAEHTAGPGPSTRARARRSTSSCSPGSRTASAGASTCGRRPTCTC